MILPKKALESIFFWHHTMEVRRGGVYDTFTIHFHQWWRRKKVIRILRDSVGDNMYSPQSGAIDLYNQLNDWSFYSYKDNFTVEKKKNYTVDEDNDNVIHVDSFKKEE